MSNTLSHEERGAFKQEIFHSLHCALPGNIISFDPDTQTASIQPAVKLGSTAYRRSCLHAGVFRDSSRRRLPGDLLRRGHRQLVRNRRSLRAEFAAEAFIVRRVCVCGVQGCRKSGKRGVV